jgi:hypothetical protein
MALAASVAIAVVEPIDRENRKAAPAQRATAHSDIAHSPTCDLCRRLQARRKISGSEGVDRRHKSSG